MGRCTPSNFHPIESGEDSVGAFHDFCFPTTSNLPISLSSQVFRDDLRTIFGTFLLGTIFVCDWQDRSARCLRLDCEEEGFCNVASLRIDGGGLNYREVHSCLTVSRLLGRSLLTQKK